MQQQKQIEALTVGLQKVSAQLAAASPSRGGLEVSKPALQVVNNPLEIGGAELLPARASLGSGPK